MDLKGSQTEKNLEAAFAAECKAHNAYAFYAAGKPRQIPPLLITTEEGDRLFEAGRKRYEERRRGKE